MSTARAKLVYNLLNCYGSPHSAFGKKACASINNVTMAIETALNKRLGIEIKC